MESVDGHGSTQHLGKGADNAMHEDETVDSAKNSKCSSSLSSYSSATCESSSQTVSPVQVPVIQVMERPVDIAPDRIPASVFENKPSSPTAWSATSNDSLFSIQIGTLSFSRDQFLTMSEDKFDELFKSGELRKSAELIWSRLHNEPSIGNQQFEVGKKYEVRDESLEDSPNENSDQQRGVPHIEGSADSSANRQQFDESGISCQPLSFPKKKKRSGWRLWPCSNYSWDFCLCTWSSFWCKWPSWKCCSMWPSCCCMWPSCGFKWPICGCKWASCGCKWPSCGCNWPHCGCNWPRCGCKWPSCGGNWRTCGCKWPGCGCKWPGCGCNWPGCGCNWPGCGCKWQSCSCCTWPSFSCCTWPSGSCCKWKSCGCCEWPSSCCKFQCPSFNRNCSSFSWSFCYPCNCRRKKLCCISFPC